MTSANFSVTILDNDEVEETEFFLILVVETGSGRIALAQEGTEVAITDDGTLHIHRHAIFGKMWHLQYRVYLGDLAITV